MIRIQEFLKEFLPLRGRDNSTNFADYRPTLNLKLSSNSYDFFLFGGEVGCVTGNNPFDFG